MALQAATCTENCYLNVTAKPMLHLLIQKQVKYKMALPHQPSHYCVYLSTYLFNLAFSTTNSTATSTSEVMTLLNFRNIIIFIKCIIYIMEYVRSHSLPSNPLTTKVPCI